MVGRSWVMQKFWAIKASIKQCSFRHVLRDAIVLGQTRRHWQADLYSNRPGATVSLP